MFKLFIYFIVGYLGYKLYKIVTSVSSAKSKVSGQNKNVPLDLTDTEVEDAHFEDVKEDE